MLRIEMLLSDKLFISGFELTISVNELINYYSL